MGIVGTGVPVQTFKYAKPPSDSQIMSTTKSGSRTTVKSSDGMGRSWYRERVFEDVTTPTYSTTVNTRGGDRKITNLDMRSTWGQPIPLVWGHSRVQGLPIWANRPIEASGAAGADIPAPSRPFVDFNPNDPPPAPDYSNLAGSLNAYVAPPPPTPSNSSSTTTFSYFSDFAYGIAYRGRPEARHFLRKMWVDGALIYDATTGFRERRWSWTFYDGSQDGPDPIMFADPQIAEDFKNIRYPGLMYVLLRNVDLSRTGLRPPDVTCEIWASNGQPASTEFFDVSPANISPERIGVNWSTRTLYGGSGTSANKLYSFDVDELTYLNEIPLQVPAGENVSQAASFLYIPWLNTVVQRGIGVASPIYFHDAGSGALLATFGIQAISNNNSPTVVAAWRHAAAVFNPFTGITYLMTVNTVNDRSINLFSHTRDGGWEREFWINDLISNNNTTGGMRAVVADNKNSAFYIQTVDGNIHRYSPILGTVELIYVNDDPDRRGYVMNYDPTLNILIAFFQNTSSGQFSFIGIQGGSSRDGDENRLLYERVAQSTPDRQSNTPNLSQQNNLLAGTLGYGVLTNSSRAIIEIATGQQRVYTQSVNGAFYGPVWDSERSLFIGVVSGQFVNRILSPFNPDDRITLGSFLQDIGERLGYARSNVVVTGITDTMIGVILVDDTNARALLQDTCNFFRLNMVESGTTLRFTKRDEGDSFNVVAELPLNKMARLAETGEAPIMTSSRLDENEIPGALVVWYIDRDADFSPVPFTASRNSQNTSRESRLNLPYVLEKQQVATLASAMLYDAWAVQLSHSFRLPPRYGYLEPGDVVDVIDGLYSDSVRLIQTIVNGDWSISITAMSVRENASPTIDADETRYRPLDESFTGGNPATTPLVVDAPLINLPINDNDTAINQVVGVSSRNQEAWPGGLVTYESISVGRGLVSNFRGNPPWGRVIGILGDASPCATDYDNVLRVQMPEVDFGVITEDASLGLQTLCAVGQPGSWEYITFGEYEWSGGVATFRKLTRGRFGTDTMMDRHRQGDFFVTMGSFFAYHFVKLEDIGSLAIYAGIGLGEDLLAGNRQQVYISGNSQRHYEPGDIQAVLDSGDIEITWKRRDRLSPSAEGWNNAGPEVIELSDPVERYQLSIYNTLTGALVRSVDVLEETGYTYTAAQQAEDGYTFNGYIRLRVWQTSTFVGAGFAKERLVNVAL
jgi:hypothetical protein